MLDHFGGHKQSIETLFFHLINIIKGPNVLGIVLDAKDDKVGMVLALLELTSTKTGESKVKQIIAEILYANVLML